MTRAPSSINDVLRGNLPANFAAIGAATNPPMTRPNMACQWLTPRRVKKVKALANVTKNSVRLTEPITYLGLLPFVINVVVTMGPQPPPPKESRKPPAPANKPYRLNFFCCCCLRNANINILIPKNKV